MQEMRGLSRAGDGRRRPPGGTPPRSKCTQTEATQYGAWFVVKKVALFIPAMFLFILAIQLMKAGAARSGRTIQGQFPFANGLSTMGTGWLGAYLVLSGSPVAATAISLFGAGTHLAPDVHDAVRLAAGRVVHRAAHRVPLRDAEPEGAPRGTSASASRR